MLKVLNTKCNFFFLYTLEIGYNDIESYRRMNFIETFQIKI